MYFSVCQLAILAFFRLSSQKPRTLRVAPFRCFLFLSRSAPCVEDADEVDSRPSFQYLSPCQRYFLLTSVHTAESSASYRYNTFTNELRSSKAARCIFERCAKSFVTSIVFSQEREYYKHNLNNPREYSAPQISIIYFPLILYTFTFYNLFYLSK